MHYISRITGIPVETLIAWQKSVGYVDNQIGMIALELAKMDEVVEIDREDVIRAVVANKKIEKGRGLWTF